MKTLLRKLATQAYEEMCEEHKDNENASAWLWEERFGELIIEEVLVAIDGAIPPMWCTCVKDLINYRFK